MRTLNTKKMIAASFAVAALSGASIALVSSASGSPAASLNVTALASGEIAALPATVSEELRSGDAADRGADAANARALSTSAGTWYLAPTNDGACLITEDSTMTCASVANVNAGSLTSIELTGGTGSGDQFRPGGSAVLRGIAPDGVAKVVITDVTGNMLASAPVTDNAYSVRVAALGKGTTLKLVGGDGSTASSQVLGG